MEKEPSSPRSPPSHKRENRSTTYWSIFSQGPTDQFASPQREKSIKSLSAAVSPSWRKNPLGVGVVQSNQDRHGDDAVSELTSLLLPSSLDEENTRTSASVGTFESTSNYDGVSHGASFPIGANHSPARRPRTPPHMPWRSPSRSTGKSPKSFKPLLLQSTRHWDVDLPPVKKHVVDGKLMETLRGTLYGNDRTRTLPVVKRKLTIELFGHDRDTGLWGGRKRRNFSDLEHYHRSGYRGGGSSCGGSSSCGMSADDASWELFKGASTDDFSVATTAKGDDSFVANDGGIENYHYELADRDIVVLRIMKSRIVNEYDDEFGLEDSINNGLKDRKWESQSMSDRTMSWMVGLDDSLSSGGALRKRNVCWLELNRTRLSQIELVREDFSANEVDLKMGVGARTVVRTFRFGDFTDDDIVSRTNKHHGNARTFSKLFKLLKRLQKERAQRLAAAHRNLRLDLDFQNPGANIIDGNDGKALERQKNIVVNSLVSRKESGEESNSEGDKRDADETVSILVEIVSASNLPTPQDKARDNYCEINPYDTGDIRVSDLIMADPEVPPSSDPYVVIRDGDVDIHKTSFITDTLNPIWTISTGSLCLLQSNLVDFFERSNVLEFTIRNNRSVVDAIASTEDEIIGTVMVHKTELLAGIGERKQHKILPSSISSSRSKNVDGYSGKSAKAPYLYLRYRQASKVDIEFMCAHLEKTNRNSLNSSECGIYGNEVFLAPHMHAAPLADHTADEDVQSTKYRVKPIPDPENKVGTEWMTKTQIEEVSRDHSTSWTMAGSGSHGLLYIEIIGCDDLQHPARSSENKINPFVNIVFEDSIVNTDVIHSCLSPRWMPWSQRAFAINLMYASSQIFVGVFDYNSHQGNCDDATTDVHHDPLGRAVINLSSLRPRAVNTLTYNLYDTNEAERKGRGTITIRLRLAIDDERRSLLSELRLKDLCYVSTVTDSDFRCASYSVTGHNQTCSPSIRNLTNFATELLGYTELTNKIIDVLTDILLWKGYPVILNINRNKEFAYKLPIHSMIAFAWATVLAYDLQKVVSFFWFVIGWALLASLEDQRRHPSPWRRPRSYTELLRILLCQKSSVGVFGSLPLRRTIQPNERLSEAQQFESDEAERAAARKEKLQRSIADREQESKRLEEEEIVTSPYISVDQNTSFESNATDDDPNVNKMLATFEETLSPFQETLRESCRLLRIGSNIFEWKENYASFWLTNLSFLASFVAFWIPWAWVMQWGFRIFAWPLFGPWMKVLDICYCQPIKKQETEDGTQSEAEILKKLYDRIRGRDERNAIRRENVLKEKDMKRYMFGKYSIKVPNFFEERYIWKPAITSSSVPYNTNPRPVNIAKRICGQRLEGDMVPYRHCDPLVDKVKALHVRNTSFLTSQHSGKREGTSR